MGCAREVVGNKASGAKDLEAASRFYHDCTHLNMLKTNFKLSCLVSAVGFSTLNPISHPIRLENIK
jgi:hypothetical protein